MKQKFSVALLASALVLGACSNEAAPEGEVSAQSGAVLEASVSDAMLPLEAVETQAQLAPPVAAGAGKPDPAAASAGDNAEKPPAAADAAAQPATPAAGAAAPAAAATAPAAAAPSQP